MALSAKQLLAASELETADVAVRSATAQVKSAEAALTQARASLSQAQVNLDQTVILSPIDGIVMSRNVDVGQTVAASMQAPTLFVLAADLTRMRVSASLDESDVGRVAAGQPVSFRVDAYPSDTFTGTVTQVRLQAVVTQNVVTYVTVVDCLNPDLKLKPGMTASVTIEVARRTDALRVAAAALRFKPSSDAALALGRSWSQGQPATGPMSPAGRSSTLWMSAGGRIVPATVETGLSDGTMTEIVTGAVDVGGLAVTAISLGTAQASAKAATTTTRSPLLSTGGPPPGGMPPPR
jgi:HlyD family secretion protein